MKILFYITYYPNFGGIEKVTTYLANQFFQEGVDVHILSFRFIEESALNELNPGVQLHVVPNHEHFICTENETFVYNLFDVHRFDNVIYQDCYSEIHELIHTLRRIFKFNYIIVEHNAPLCKLIQYKDYWRRLKWSCPKDIVRKLAYPYKNYIIKKSIYDRHCLLLTQCDHYVTLADSYTEDINRITKNQFQSIILSIANPLTLYQSRFSPELKRKEVLFVGRITLQKGIHYLLDIWEQISLKHTDWNLKIVGNGEDEDSAKEIVVQRGIKNIYFIGPTNNVLPLYERASILIMTSLFEGYPLVLNEAMSCGCVPIAFNSFSALPEIISNTQTGIIVPAFKVEKYIEELSSLMNDHYRLQTMAIQCVHASKDKTVESAIKKWKKILV